MHYREKLDIIFMRDNGPRRSIHMRRSNFFLLVTIFACLPFLCILLMTQCWLLWQESVRLRDGLERAETELQSLEARAERLENLEDLLKEENAPGRGIITAQLAGKPRPAIADASSESDAETEPGPGHEEFPAIDSGRVKVGNVQARALRGNRLRIGLDLRNPDNEPLLSGDINATLLTAAGERVPLDFSPREASTFRISRFKRAVLAAGSPRDEDLVNAQVILEVRDQDGKTIYRNIFAVMR